MNYIEAVEERTGRPLGFVEPGTGLWRNTVYYRGGRKYLRVRTERVGGRQVAFFRKCEKQPEDPVWGFPTEMRILSSGAV